VIHFDMEPHGPGKSGKVAEYQATRPWLGFERAPPHAFNSKQEGDGWPFPYPLPQIHPVHRPLLGTTRTTLWDGIGSGSAAEDSQRVEMGVAQQREGEVGHINE